MQRVTGIGGFFFRAKNPAGLGKWYQEHLGVGPVPTDDSQGPWTQEAGPTAFAPFEQDTEYFGDANKGWMLNFRVRDLDGMVAQLRAAGLPVTVDPETYPIGRFARLHDPEGNPVELWEPQENRADPVDNPGSGPGTRVHRAAAAASGGSSAVFLGSFASGTFVPNDLFF